MTALAPRLWRPTRFALILWGCFLGPAIATVIVVKAQIASGAYGFDFKATVYDPGRAILEGRSPYPDAALGALVGRPTFVYPPLLLWVDVPVAMLPYAAAQVVWRVIEAAGVAWALWLVGVRDPRCYAIGLLSVPIVSGLVLGNVMVLFVLGIALAWRYRDHAWAGGAAVGLLVAIKLILWPLFVWLLVTRRFKSAAIGAAAGLGSVLVSWALIGFQGLMDYPELLRIVADKTAGPRAYSVAQLAQALTSIPEPAAQMVQRAGGLALIALALVVARGRDGDRRSFSAVIVAALVISPVVWMHYFGLLLVPIALMRTRFGAIWLIPFLYWGVVWLPLHLLRLSEDPDRLVGYAPSVGRVGFALSLMLATLAATTVDWAAVRRRLAHPRWMRPAALPLEQVARAE
jgi:Glycosyltransferase family 87